MGSDILLGLILLVVSVSFSSTVVFISRRRIEKIRKHNLSSLREIYRELESGR